MFLLSMIVSCLSGLEEVASIESPQALIKRYSWLCSCLILWIPVDQSHRIHVAASYFMLKHGVTVKSSFFTMPTATENGACMFLTRFA